MEVCRTSLPQGLTPLSPRPGPLRADLERRAAYEGKGGVRAVGRGGRVASPLVHDKGYYWALFAAVELATSMVKLSDTFLRMAKGEIGLDDLDVQVQ